MRRMCLVWMVLLICRPVLSQSDSLVDVSPLAIDNQWTYGYSYEWSDDPGHNPMWQWSDSGNVAIRISGKTVALDSTRWFAQETGNHWTRYNGGAWAGPTLQLDSFEIVELHSGNHPMYKTGALDHVRRSVLPFVQNLVDTARVYRFARVDANGIRTVRTHEAPVGPIYMFRFQGGVGLLSVGMSDGCTCFPSYGTTHVLRSSIITGISSPPPTTMQEVFRLDQNYPNPFNPSTTIEYQLQEQRPVTLTVCDIVGRAVATLVNEVKQPGAHTVQWNAGNIAGGVYFYRLQAGNFTQTKRFLLLR